MLSTQTSPVTCQYFLLQTFPFHHSYTHRFHEQNRGCCHTVPTTSIIPSKHKTRRPANIPLRTLSNRIDNEHSEALLGSRSQEKAGRRSFSSVSSEESWSDTGDLAEQLADTEDPLQIKIRDPLDDQISRGSAHGSKQKKVRYHKDIEHREEKSHSGVVKEDIEIPEPEPRHISRVEHLLAAIMSGGERQMRGLTGKPLVYA